MERSNITLDDEPAEKLAWLAARMHLQPARSRGRCSPALDDADPDARNVVELLDGIPAAFFAGNEERRVRGGDIVVVPGGTPHRFVNSGDGPLRQLSIHLSPRFATEWLDA